MYLTCCWGWARREDQVLSTPYFQERILPTSSPSQYISLKMLFNFTKSSLNLITCNKNFISSTYMIKSNFLKKVHFNTAAIFIQNFNIFHAKLEPQKSSHLTLFQKFTSQSISILAIISHPHFLVGSNHLSSTTLKNVTISFQRLIYMFLRFSKSCSKQ